MDEKLKPCPFCSDPMWQHGVSGIIRHVDQSKSNECILAHTAFIDLKAWNTAPHLAMMCWKKRCACSGAVGVSAKVRANGLLLFWAISPWASAGAYSRTVAPL